MLRYRVIIGLVALALVVFQPFASAQSPISAFPPGTFQSRAPLDAAAGGGSPVLVFQAAPAAVAPAASSTTFTSVAIGTASASRVVIVVVNTESFVVTSLTVGGVGATKAVEESTLISGLQTWYATVASGTTANIVLNASGSMTGAAIIVFSATGITAAPTQTKTAINNTGTSPTALPTITVPATGFAVAANTSAATATGITWSNATQDATTDMISGTHFSAAHTASTGAPTVSWTGPANNHMVGVAEGP